MIVESVSELIGNTPIIKLQRVCENLDINLYAKCEFLNPTYSIKDRIGYNMIQEALKKGLIDKNTVLIEPTSGNTGIALASTCASLGMKLVLTMPESMSKERISLLKAFGAKLVLTPSKLGMKGAVDKAKELANEIENSYILDQFQNRANPRSHIKTTAVEIVRDMGKNIDIFVSSVGTGGTITGIGHIIKEANPDVKIVAVEPAKSPILSGGDPGVHAIQGIGAGFIPKVLDMLVYDEVCQVKDEDAIDMSRKLAKKEGLLVGISSGANVFASIQVGSKKENRGKNIVTMLCDTGERYISSGLYE
ncbi:MAG: cysteine synthase A [Epsilonproteobacteria bacterium]|nr:cysteine synthase A [Campylobacterota bacterium]